jgi:diphthine synthase
LGDARDLTLRGRDAIASSDRVFLECYTSILGVGADALSAAFGKPVELAHRETVESEADTILAPAVGGQTVSFLVVGDPFGATTHTDLLLRAHAAGVPTRVVHNASIMNAVGACGLQLYTFGQTISIPFFRDAWQPDSFYDRIAHNASGGLHTLCLLGAFCVRARGVPLPYVYPSPPPPARVTIPCPASPIPRADIKVRELDFGLLARTGRKAYLPPRFMTIRRAILQLLAVERKRGRGVCPPGALAVGVARVGQDAQRIVSGTLEQLAGVDFGGPLHSLVLAGGPLHEVEAAMVAHFAVKPEELGAYEEEFSEEWDGECAAEGGGEGR